MRPAGLAFDTHVSEQDFPKYESFVRPFHAASNYYVQTKALQNNLRWMFTLCDFNVQEQSKLFG